MKKRVIQIEKGNIIRDDKSSDTRLSPKRTINLFAYKSSLKDRTAPAQHPAWRTELLTQIKEILLLVH